MTREAAAKIIVQNYAGRVHWDARGEYYLKVPSAHESQGDDFYEALHALDMTDMPIEYGRSPWQG